MESKNSFQRQPAVKTTLSELLAGKYIQDEEQAPNYLLSLDGSKLYRINVVAVVLGRTQQGAITILQIDDGTGSLPVYFFESNPALSQIQIGDAVFIIGKVRMYNQEKYLSPEIIKKINPLWLKLRALELRKERPLPPVVAVPEPMPEVDASPSEEIEEVELKLEADLPIKKITSLIKELDKGEGAQIEEVIAKSFVKDTEQWIQKMLERGDIFQNLPGRVKLL